MTRRIAILGGGMAGLTAAWSLSAPHVRDDVEITVYQRGWRLGGKGASSRGPHGRIEEHGLHVWLGYYDNAFRLMREVYGELDRERSDPACPVATWRDAFVRAERVGLEELHDGEWSRWMASFPTDELEPGSPSPGPGPRTMLTYFERALRLLFEFARSIRPSPSTPAEPASVVLSASPHPPQRGPQASRGDIAALLRNGEIAATIAIVEALRLLDAGLPASNAMTRGLHERLERIRDGFEDALEHADDARRSRQLVDIVLTSLQGALRDGLLTPVPDFAHIEHLDFRAWLAGHGARQETLASPLVSGVYDLVFGYEGGDKERPRFAAGIGLFLSWKMFFDYKGALFWKLTAGMGDIVFAPLYEALRARGVRFEFFHRVDRLCLGADRTAIAAIELGRQARLAPGRAEYDPLVRVRGLPCFPSLPLTDQLDGAAAADLESAWAPRDGEEPVTLLADRDFDEVVLATSLGILPDICDELVAHAPRWREMVDRVGTVATQALQVWMAPTDRELGWPYPGSTVTGYVPPFDTYASMTHVLATEDWPAPRAPGSIAYFCAVLPEHDARAQGAAGAHVRANAIEFLTRSGGHFWPAAVTREGEFRWGLLAGDGLDALYWRANVDPSDRYVQSLPGTARSRLRADGSGYANLVLAGDWIDCGLNAGCIEAATLGGLQAANAILRRAPMEGVLGTWCRLGDRERSPR